MDGFKIGTEPRDNFWARNLQTFNSCAPYMTRPARGSSASDAFWFALSFKIFNTDNIYELKAPRFKSITEMPRAERGVAFQGPRMEVNRVLCIWQSVRSG